MIEEEINLGERKKVKNAFEELNFAILFHVIKRSLIYVLFFTILTGFLAWLYLRYTPDVYESSVVLMTKQSKQTQLLGIEDILKDDATEVKLEIDLLRSPLLIKRALDSLGIYNEYFTKGRILDTENYKTNPYSVDFNLINSEIEEREIFITFSNLKNYQYQYTLNKEVFNGKGKVGENIENAHFSMNLKLKEGVNYSSLKDVDFYFKHRNKDGLVDEVISNSIVQPGMADANTLKIIYRSTNKIKSKDIIEKITEIFVAYDIEKKAESINSILSFLTNQIDYYDADYSRFQDSVKDIRISTGFVDPAVNTEVLLGKAKEFEEALLKIKYSNKGLNWFKDYLNSDNSLASISPMFIDANIEGFTTSVNRIIELERDKELKLLEVTKDHPQVVMIDNELNDLKYNLFNQVNLVYQKNLDESSRIELEKKKVYSDLYKNPDKEIIYSRIINENGIRKTFLDNLIGSKSNYLIAKAGIISDYIYLQNATNAKLPIAPDRKLIQFVGIAIGLLLGLMLIVIKYLMHNNITSLKEIEENSNANVLGVIPSYNTKMSQSKIVVADNPKASLTEAFRSIRTNLEFLNKDNNGHSKLVVTTSTVPGEGKTFVGINLATIFSLLNKKVIIVDFDLRKPRLSSVFEVPNQKGTSTILIGKSTIEECIKKSDIPNLDFITSGPIPPNPSELISNKSTSEFIEKLQEKYDYVFLDTPPIGLVIDALSLLQKADYPIYVVRADYSERQYLENVNKLIFDNKITKLSVVLNDFGRGASGTAQKYGYGYGYGYGNGQGYYSDDQVVEGVFSKIKNIFKK